MLRFIFVVIVERIVSGLLKMAFDKRKKDEEEKKKKK